VVGYIRMSWFSICQKMVGRCWRRETKPQSALADLLCCCGGGRPPIGQSPVLGVYPFGKSSCRDSEKINLYNTFTVASIFFKEGE
jgi:hypothetical protein